MRHSIATAPKDGHFVILEDDANAAYDIGRWSPQAGGWVGKHDGPIQITPTHWHSVPPNAYLHAEGEETFVADPLGKRAWARFLMPVVLVITATIGVLYFAKLEVARSPVSGNKAMKIGEVQSRDVKAALSGAGRGVERPTGPSAEAAQAVRERRNTIVSDSQQDGPPKLLAGLAQAAATAPALAEERGATEISEARQPAAPVTEQVRKEPEQDASFAEQTTQLRQANELAAGWKQVEGTKTGQSLEQHRQSVLPIAETVAARLAVELEQEQTRSAALELELALARREIEIQAEQSRQANSGAEQSKQAEIAKVERSLAEQRESAAVAVADAEAARQELKARTAQQDQKADEEQIRSAALTSELAAARREIEGQEAQLRQAKAEAELHKQAEMAAIQQSSEQQGESVAAALSDAAAARQELRDRTMQHDQMLAEERARSAALAGELAVVRREIETQAAQPRQGIAETALQQQAETPNIEQLLEDLRQRLAAAVADAAAARQELATNTAQHRQALDEVHARNGSIASELATAQQANNELILQFRLVGEQSELRGRAYAAELATLQQALKQERDSAAAGAAELDAARRVAAARAQPETASSGSPSREMAPTALPAVTPSATLDMQGGTEAAKMIARASLLLGQGDIGSARTVLERAAELGSVRAEFMLAETYDPGILSAWKTYGTRSDVARAREHYAKAQAGGMQEAKERLDTLGQ